MKETISKCYCDILSEHNNQKVEGAKPYKNISVLVMIDGTIPCIREIDLDMCDACKAKYAPNLRMVYDASGNSSYVFAGETIEEPATEGQ